MKKVLIALDYSNSAQKVAETGYTFAKSMGANIALLHVMEDTTFYSILEYPAVNDFMGFTHNEMKHLFDKGPKEAMQLFLNQTRLFLDDESIELLLKDGEFAETILTCAHEIKADIIVIGSHSKGWLRKIVLGDVTEGVLKHTPLPLLIVPTKNN